MIGYVLPNFDVVQFIQLRELGATTTPPPKTGWEIMLNNQ